jgi:hypothetical protein
MVTTTTTTTTTEGALRSKGLKKSQHSDGAIEMLQTMCLIIAFTLQRVANILDRASSNTNALNAEDQQQKTQGDDDVFDIDPLLMPLLYLCDQQQHEQDDMSGNSRIGETFQDLFQSSTLMTLGYINKNVGGADLGALEVKKPDMDTILIVHIPRVPYLNSLTSPLLCPTNY